MDILAKAKEHFLDQIRDNTNLIDVPEWDMKIYVKPMTGMQQDRISKYITDGKYFEAQVEAVVLRALDEDGNRLFNNAHKQELMRKVDRNIIASISEKMGSFEQIIGDSEAKNS